MKVTINKPAADALADSAVRMLKSVGSAADRVGAAADAVSASTAKLRKARWAFRAWGAVALSDLLARLFGRRQ